MENKFGQGSAIPWKTTDAILAQCLAAAGVPECPWSPVNVYTEEILFTAGGGIKDKRPSRWRGMSIIEAARKAWSEKTRGRVEYHFEHTQELKPLLKAYQEQQLIIESPEGERDASEAIREIQSKATNKAEDGSIMDEREAILRVMCITLKLRVQFVNRWKSVAPTLFIADNKPTETIAGVERIAGGKVVSVDASEALLKKMNLV